MAKKRIELADHLSTEDLKQRYLAASDATEARRWQVLWLIAQGHSTKEAAAVVGVTRRTALRIVTRYNVRGAEGDLDARRTNPGRRPKLTNEQQGKLLEALRGRAPDGGLWTGPKVAEWVRHETGFDGGKNFGWMTLKRLGARLVSPRRHHEKAADEDDQEAWKDALARRLERERRDAILVGRAVEVWAEDEARLGLKPILRRVWVVGPERPLARTWHKYEWLYVVAFVHPSSGRTHWLILPTIDAELFSLALEEFARQVGVGPRKTVVLVLDGAGWHTAADLRVPEGIVLVPLPPYTPEMQPAEHLWPLMNETIANRPIASLDELEQDLSERCRALIARTDQIKAVTNFHWWPQAA
jgi:transposase